MTLERWQDIQALVKDKFAISNQGTQQLEDEPGTMEFLEFTGPLGPMRCEFFTRPKVLDKRGMGGHAVGRKVHYEYSPDEKVHEFVVMKLVNGDWEEIDPGMFA